MKFDLKTLLGFLLFFLSRVASAYNGAGAECTPIEKTNIGKAVIAGSAFEMPALLEEEINKRWELIHPEVRNAIEKNSEAHEHWKEETKDDILNLAWGCFQRNLLDYAVSNGNVEVTKWLLGAGANPTGDLGSTTITLNTIFTRCLFLDSKKSHLPKEKISRGVRDAYTVLVTSGADINKKVVIVGYEKSYKTECKNREMVAMFDELGKDIPPKPLPKNPFDPYKPYDVQNLLERDLYEGKLRRADAKTFIRWMNKFLDRPWYRKFEKIQVPEFWNAYILDSDWYKFPPGLTGNQAHIFFVPEPRDWREPQKKLEGVGDSTVYYFRDGKCSGPKC